MRLTGIQIEVDGVEKFVGKVGRCPRNQLYPELVGVPVFYREVPYRDVYSYQARALGVDAAAWDEAVKLGAEGMIIYCSDKQLCFYVSKQKMAAESFLLDLGEFPQYRIPVTFVTQRNTYKGLPFGFTSNVTTVGAARRGPVIDLPSTPGPVDIQLGLF